METTKPTTIETGLNRLHCCCLCGCFCFILFLMVYILVKITGQ